MKHEESKLASASATRQEHDSNGVSSRYDKNITNATDSARTAIAIPGCQSHENGAYTALLRKAHNHQHAGVKSSSLPQNLANHQLSPQPQPQQFVLSPHPLWLYSRNQLAGMEALAGYPQEAPNFGYHVGYSTHLGFPGYWDTSFWWGQGQHILVPWISTYPGAYGYVSSQSLPNSNCVATSGQPLPRGVIKPPQKLSQNHQRLWEVQSAENVQLWNVIGQLQVELADCKNQLIKLEAELSSLRPGAEEPPLDVQNGEITVAERPRAKRGRPRRELGSQSRARGRKSALKRSKMEVKQADPEKAILIEMDDKVKDCRFPDTTEKDRDEKTSATSVCNNGNTEISEGQFLVPSSWTVKFINQQDYNHVESTPNEHLLI